MANGVVRGAVFQFGDVAAYSCFGGYAMEGVGRSRCLENGTWTPPPTCRGRGNTEGTLLLFPGHFLLHLTVPFAHDAALPLSFLFLLWTASAHPQQISLSSNACFYWVYTSCMCEACGSSQEVVAMGSFLPFPHYQLRLGKAASPQSLFPPAIP